MARGFRRARPAGSAVSDSPSLKSQPRTGHTREPDPTHNELKHTTTRKTATHKTENAPQTNLTFTRSHTHTSRLTFGAANRSRSIARGRRAPEGGAKGVRRGGGSTILWSIVCVHHMPRAQPAGYAARGTPVREQQQVVSHRSDRNYTVGASRRPRHDTCLRIFAQPPACRRPSRG